MLLTQILLWIFWLDLGVGRVVCFLLGLVGSFLVPFGSLLFTSCVLFGTSWFFCSIYCLLSIKTKKNLVYWITYFIVVQISVNAFCCL